MQYCSIVFVLLSLHVPAVKTALIASSKLEQCVNDGTTEALPCEEKFTVALSIAGGQNNTETVAYWRGGLAPDGSPLVLSSPVRITVSKTAPMVRYPVLYTRTFNAKPREEVIYTGILKCNDGATDESPTCGRAYDDAGLAVPFSEGFCCNCGMCDVLGFCSSDSRANTDCSIFGDGASASCLSFDPLWYAGYRIGPAETWYTITVTIEQQGRPPAYLHLGPDQLGTKSMDYEVTAQLIGDFSPFKTPKNLESRLLFIPSAPLNHPKVQAPTPQEWMLMESHLVDSTGSQCDKIGVSYEAFASQGNQCKLHVGSCLKNQLSDYREMDAGRQAQGLSAEYLVSGHGDFVILDGEPVANTDQSKATPERRVVHPQAATRPYMAYEVDGVQNSMITLTFVADNISFIINVAKGEIVAVNISDFQANTKEGKLKVVILNTGRVAADFHVTVRNCTKGTFPITANVATLQPLHPHEFTFDVYSENLQQQLNSCNVSLYNAAFDLLDTTAIQWTSTDTIDDRGSQGGGGNGARGVPVNPPPPLDDASATCTDCPWYNPMCFLTRQCFWEVVVQIVVVFCIILLLIALIKNRGAIASCCGGDAGEDKSKKKENKKSRRRSSKHRRSTSSSSSSSEEGRKRNATPPTAVAVGGGSYSVPVMCDPYTSNPPHHHQHHHHHHLHPPHHVAVYPQEPQPTMLLHDPFSPEKRSYPPYSYNN